ncbi:hypothetical protein Goari_005185, partial [Gossypium aridum]|nr:hypothetical protein [Gossypium aridum]
MSNLTSYGKVNESDQAMMLQLQARRKSRKRIAIISLSFIVLAAIVVAAVLGSTRSSKGDSSNGRNTPTQPLSTSIKAVCDVTLHKDSCYKSLSPMANSTELGPEDVFRLSMEAAVSEILKASQYFIISNNGDYMTNLAMENCRQLLGLAIDHLNSSLSSSTDSVDDLRTWLSSAVTYHQTCIDGFEEFNGVINRDDIDNHLKFSSEVTSNSLAIITWISKVKTAFNLRRRRLMNLEAREEHQWRSHRERVLLESSNELKKKADIIVAKDGSGKFKTIMEAIKAVPKKSKKKRTVIYVKKGVYKENVKVEKNKWNVTMIGDGMNSTIVTGKLNVVDGTPTFSTATF